MRARTWTALVAIAALAGCGSSGRSGARAPTSTRPTAPATDASFCGEADRADPYGGPMIGVFSTKTGQGGFVGDADRTPVTVRGLPADAAPITVFQQSIVPELGTVIAWTENGRDVGLYGRL